MQEIIEIFAFLFVFSGIWTAITYPITFFLGCLVVVIFVGLVNFIEAGKHDEER